MAEPTDQQELNAHRETVIYIDALITEAKPYFRSEPVRLQELAQEILYLSTPIQYNYGIAYGEYFTGRVLYLQSEFEQALPHYIVALQLFEQLNDISGLKNLLRHTGLTYQMLSRYGEALNYYQRELEIRQRYVSDDVTGMSAIVTNIATLYLFIGQHDVALAEYLKALDLLENHRDDSVLGGILVNIANLYMSLGNYEEAMKYLQQGLSIYREEGDKKMAAGILLNIGWNYLQSKLYEKSLEYSFLALEMFEEVGDRRQKAIALQHIGQAYLHMRQYIKSLGYFEDSYAILYEVGERRGCADTLRSMGDLFATIESYEEAKKRYKDALDIVRQIGLRQTEYELCELIATIEEQTNNTKQALYYYREYMKLKEDVLAEHRLKTISEMQVRFNVEQSQKEKEIYRMKNVELADALEKVEALNHHLSEANNEKNELLGIVAHDLKNPISGLALSLSLLNNYLPRMEQEEILRQVGQMSKTVQRMEEIVAKLLDINIIDSGKMIFQLKVWDLNKLILAVIEDYEDRLRDKNISIRFELSQYELPVHVDREAILEILENLVSNAVKYSPYNEHIIIRSTFLETVARFEIQDNGPGINPADYDKLFKKFVRLEAKPTGGESSTGLGLSIVKKLTDAMQGRVWCESSVSKGALFIVELPIAAYKSIP
jgi:signal transduction histidine kinase